MRTYISATIAFIVGTALNVLIFFALSEVFMPLGIVWALLVVHHYMRVVRSVLHARRTTSTALITKG